MFGANKPDAELAQVIWTSQEIKNETIELRDLPWYKNYRYQALALVITVIIILLVY
jgi:hypothetical protein